MYIPKSIMEFLSRNHTWEKRKLFYEKNGEHYPPYDGSEGCEEYMIKLTEAVKDVIPKEWNEIIPLKMLEAVNYLKRVEEQKEVNQS